MSALAAASATDYQKKPTSEDGSDACPEWDIDRLLLPDGEFDRAKFHSRCVFGVAEAAVSEAKRTNDNKSDCNEFDSVQGWTFKSESRPHVLAAQARQSGRH